MSGPTNLSVMGPYQRRFLYYGVDNFGVLPGSIFIDKSAFIARLEKLYSNYAYILLRPPRFGKTMLLLMLSYYYDIHAAGIFDQIFGKLDISRNPTESRNKHLVLRFDFSSLRIFQSGGTVERAFNNCVNAPIKFFLWEYARELGNLTTGNIIDPNDASVSLTRVLDHVHRCDHTLFVCVDEYDSPIKNFRFDGPLTEEECSLLTTNVESWYNYNFFGILQRAPRGLIAKYILVGTIPAFVSGSSPLSAATVVSHSLELQNICGFTEQEVQRLTDHYFPGETKNIIPKVLGVHGGYHFAKGKEETTVVFNPHLVIHLLSTPHLPAPGLGASLHATGKLGTAMYNFSHMAINELLGFYNAGRVQVDIKPTFDISDLYHAHAVRQTAFSLIYYYGLMSGDSEGNLVVANKHLHEEFRLKIGQFLRNPANTHALFAKSSLFLCCIPSGEKPHLPSQPTNPALLQSTLHYPSQTPIASILHTKPPPPPPGYSYTPIRFPGHENVNIQLRNIPILALFRGKLGNPNAEPTESDLQKLAARISQSPKEEVFAMKYTFWSPSQQRAVTTTVGETMKFLAKQVSPWIQVIQLACVWKWNVTEGSSDEDPGDVGGNLLMCIGGHRVLGVQCAPLAVTYKELAVGKEETVGVVGTEEAVGKEEDVGKEGVMGKKGVLGKDGFLDKEGAVGNKEVEGKEADVEGGL